MGWHSAIKRYSIMFLSCRKICWGRVWMVFGKWGKHGLYVPLPPLSQPIRFLSFHSIQGEQLLMSHLHPHGLGWAFHSRGLPALAGLCRSLGGIYKFGVMHLALLIAESMSDLIACETLTCKCLRCLCH